MNKVDNNHKISRHTGKKPLPVKIIVKRVYSNDKSMESTFSEWLYQAINKKGA